MKWGWGKGKEKEPSTDIAMMPVFQILEALGQSGFFPSGMIESGQQAAENAAPIMQAASQQDMMSPQARGGLLSKFGGTGAGMGNRGQQFGAAQYQDMSAHQLPNLLGMVPRHPTQNQWQQPASLSMGSNSVLASYLKGLLGVS